MFSAISISYMDVRDHACTIHCVHSNLLLTYFLLTILWLILEYSCFFSILIILVQMPVLMLFFLSPLNLSVLQTSAQISPPPQRTSLPPSPHCDLSECCICIFLYGINCFVHSVVLLLYFSFYPINSLKVR